MNPGRHEQDGELPDDGWQTELGPHGDGMHGFSGSWGAAGGGAATKVDNQNKSLIWEN